MLQSQNRRLIISDVKNFFVLIEINCILKCINHVLMSVKRILSVFHFCISICYQEQEITLAACILTRFLLLSFNLTLLFSFCWRYCCTGLGSSLLFSCFEVRCFDFYNFRLLLFGFFLGDCFCLENGLSV